MISNYGHFCFPKDILQFLGDIILLSHWEEESCWHLVPRGSDYSSNFYVFLLAHYSLTIMVFFEIHFSPVTQSCPTLCDPKDCSTPGFRVHHQLSELTQTHVHWVSDAIQPPHSLSCPFPPAFNNSQHQSLFKWVSSLYHVAKLLEFQLQHQSFQWIFRVDFL